PGMVLGSPLLNGTNYHSWNRSMRRTLLNKLKLIDSSIRIHEHSDPACNLNTRNSSMQGTKIGLNDLMSH
ncbi:hypothetical protein VIGAN_07093500, partial [Vigna angularis var. angularis]